MQDNTNCPYCGKPIAASDADVTRHNYDGLTMLWHQHCIPRAERADAQSRPWPRR